MSDIPSEYQVRMQAEYSATCWHTSVAGNMQVFRQEHASGMNQGGTAGGILTRPWLY